MREWHHTFIYDEVTLRYALSAAGFDDVVTSKPGYSEHRHLAGIDQHHNQIGTAFNEIESMVVEAS
jgi:hypothetical protein